MTATQPSFGAESTPGRGERASGLWGPATVDVTVVIPFFNPGAALRGTVLAVIEYLAAADVSFEVIAVSDGSTDSSADTITDLPHTRVLINPTNQGKGAALRRGFAAAGGAWIGFIDADGDINPRHLVDYLDHARAGGRAGVYADKRHTNSDSCASGLRKAISLTYSTFISGLFRLGIRDTQTGCKIFRRDVVAELLPRLHERRFALDLELFVAARAAGITDFVAAPVNLESRVNGSTIRRKCIVRALIDTFAVYGRHHVRTGSARTCPILDRDMAAPARWWHYIEPHPEAA
jgi:glycosyltransferase involved in cell wall biosynthesis